jgi:hypothetical protein
MRDKWARRVFFQDTKRSTVGSQKTRAGMTWIANLPGTRHQEIEHRLRGSNAPANQKASGRNGPGVSWFLRNRIRCFHRRHCQIGRRVRVAVPGKLGFRTRNIEPTFPALYCRRFSAMRRSFKCCLTPAPTRMQQMTLAPKRPLSSKAIYWTVTRRRMAKFSDWCRNHHETPPRSKGLSICIIRVATAPYDEPLRTMTNAKREKNRRHPGTPSFKTP